jgi:hypothetical protein
VSHQRTTKTLTRPVVELFGAGLVPYARPRPTTRLRTYRTRNGQPQHRWARDPEERARESLWLTDCASRPSACLFLFDMSRGVEILRGGTSFVCPLFL